ncbi:MAG: stage II sporulation protein M [Polyangiaceae bacterium]
MIPQDEFVALRQRDWTELDALIGKGGSLHSRPGPTISRAASLYRSLCNDVMRAEGLRYSTDLLIYLHALAGRTHNVLYGAKPVRSRGALAFVFGEFPAALRANWRLFALSSALFLLPFFIGLIGASSPGSFAERVLPASALEGAADMYKEGFSGGRGSGLDAQMTGFYVWNNVGIAFRVFATGVLFGLGSVFYLIYNGLVIGTTVGYVMRAGHGDNIWTFMCGHGPYEITAILIAGGAGLQMGYALVATDGLTRFGSFRRHLRPILAQIAGAAVMLVIAALIEGFWSPSSLPPPIKWAFSAVNLLLVGFFLLFAGRDRAASSPLESPP